MLLEAIAKRALHMQKALVVIVSLLFVVMILLHNTVLALTYEETLAKVVNILVFDLLAALGLISYARAIVTKPGTPFPYRPTRTDPSNFCFKCNNWKPPRTHHCQVCNKCTLMMDHHCPWIANCVGFFNIKYFFLICFYTTVCGSYFYASLALSIFDGTLSRHLPKIVYWGFVCCTLAIAPFIGSVGYMLWRHIKLLLSSATSIEHVRGVKGWDFVSCSPGNVDKNEYYLEALPYIERIFGKSMLGWLLPITNYKQHGYEFPTVPFLITPIRKSKKKPEKKVIKGASDVEQYLEEVTKKYVPEQVVYHNLILVNNLPLPPGFIVAKPYTSNKDKSDDTN